MNKCNKKTKSLFTLVQINEDISETSKSFNEIKSIFQNAQSLDDIIDSWMNPEKKRELSFTVGYDKTDELQKEAIVTIILEEGTKEIGAGQCSKSNLSDSCPLPKELEKIAPDNFAEEKGEELWLPKRDEILQIIFNEIYCEHHIPRENVQSLLLLYLLSNSPVEIELFFVDQDSLYDTIKDYDNIESLIEDAKNYVCVSLVTYDPENLDTSAGEFISFFLKKNIIQ